MLSDDEIKDDLLLDEADRFAKWADAGISHYRIGKVHPQKVALPYMQYLTIMGVA